MIICISVKNEHSNSCHCHNDSIKFHQLSPCTDEKMARVHEYI